MRAGASCAYIMYKLAAIISLVPSETLSATTPVVPVCPSANFTRGNGRDGLSKCLCPGITKKDF